MSSDPEFVVLVDAQDQAIGQEEKLRAHQLGLLHRAFSVFIFRGSGAGLEVLLQQRNPLKYHCPSLWTNACCSHPRAGEEIVAAAERRLPEELGIQIKLKSVGHFLYRAEFSNGLIEHELDHVLVGYYEETPLPFNPEEVAAVRWETLKNLRIEWEQKPETFTPWFKQALEIALADLESSAASQQVGRFCPLPQNRMLL